MEDSGGAANFNLISSGRSYDVIGDPFEERENSSENSGDSPPSTTVSLNSLSSPKRSRRAIQKKVVTVPIKEIEGGRFSKGGDCTTPPSDSWAWRKYGQKPIKGSPYPRGYYRCSSSKGCPARKQVERNRLDPTMLVITYSYDHNHSFPVSRNHHNSHHPTTVSATATAPSHSPTLIPTKPATTSTASVANSIPAPEIKQDPTHISNYSTSSYPNNNNNKYDQAVRVSISSMAVGGQSQLVDAKFSDHLARDDSLITTDEFTWAAITDLDTSTSTSVPFSSSMFLSGGPISDDVELARYFPTREEDDSDLFADLGELPECSVVFGRSAAAAEEEETRRRQCGLAAAAPWCG